MRIIVQKHIYTVVIVAIAIAIQLGSLSQAFAGPAINDTPWITLVGAKVLPVAYASLTVTQTLTALGGAVVAVSVLEALGRFKHGRTTS